MNDNNVKKNGGRRTFKLRVIVMPSNGNNNIIITIKNRRKMLDLL